jgi:hypothetical protein
MTLLSRRLFLASSAAAAACTPVSRAAARRPEAFVCPPCGCAMDDVAFAEPGYCPDCGMILTPKEETDLGFAPARLAPGAGAFRLPGGTGRENATIRVHYYRPDGFGSASPILLVIPGAGRNGAEYRNAWLATARAHNVLVASLEYSEDNYDFAAYHMGGLIRNLSFSRPVQDDGPSNVVRLDDSDIRFDVNPDAQTWLFNDFDRVFDVLVQATGSQRRSYDIFGHSAGGQILHRMALTRTRHRAGRIVAANSGFYTLPDLQRPPLTGLAGTGITDAALARAFSSNLVLLLGEEDNGDHAGGTMLHTPLVDEQGAGRFSRGRYFHRVSRDKAREIGADFRWRVETVPGVGHEFGPMSAAAGAYLYGAGAR